MSCLSPRPRRRSRSRGFTLFEVLVALGVLVALSAAVYAFAFEILAKRTSIRERADRVSSAALVLDRLESALASCVASTRDGEAGVTGDGTSVTVRSARVDATRNATPLATLRLAFAESDSALEASASSDGDAEPVVTGIRRVRLRYHDGRRWRSRFDSAAARALPVAVDIALWFGETGDDDTASASAGLPADAEFFGSAVEDGAFGASAEDERIDDAPSIYRVIAVPDAAESGFEGGSGSGGPR